MNRELIYNIAYKLTCETALKAKYLIDKAPHYIEIVCDTTILTRYKILKFSLGFMKIHNRHYKVVIWVDIANKEYPLSIPLYTKINLEERLDTYLKNGELLQEIIKTLENLSNTKTIKELF